MHLCDHMSAYHLRSLTCHRNRWRSRSTLRLSGARSFWLYPACHSYAWSKIHQFLPGANDMYLGTSGGNDVLKPGQMVKDEHYCRLELCTHWKKAMNQYYSDPDVGKKHNFYTCLKTVVTCPTPWTMPLLAVFVHDTCTFVAVFHHAPGNLAASWLQKNSPSRKPSLTCTTDSRNVWQTKKHVLNKEVFIFILHKM